MVNDAFGEGRSAPAEPSPSVPAADDRDDTWLGDDVVLTSVGVDIGSATTHLAFSRIRMRRKAEQLSSAYVVVERTLLGTSPIALTPYGDDGLIDAAGVEAIVTAAYAEAGLIPDDIDTGALILTGEAVKRSNARPIAERLAAAAGRFVCASAGPALEATMAAHGSGSVALSRTLDGDVLNVDIGGGSTKFSVIADGRIIQTAALEVGGRLIVERDGRVIRLESTVDPILTALGIDPALGAELGRVDRWRIGRAMADIVVDAIRGRALPDPFAALWLTEPLRRDRAPAAMTVSGGVGEYVLDAGGMDLGDLGLPFAEGLRHAIEGGALPPLRTPVETAIRATVLGASQFTVQVSGSTIYVSDRRILPVHDLPVVKPVGTLSEVVADPGSLRTALRRLDLDDGPHAMALAVSWDGPPAYPRLRTFCDWLTSALPGPWPEDLPLVLAIDADVAYLIGRLLADELGWRSPLICLDSIDVQEFDYLDIGQLVEPQGVVPIVVKSLVFAQASGPATGGSLG
jgi:ethanolamine utilization protein EutA